MQLATGNVDIHFANVTIEVNSAGHDIFQRVSNGIKTGDQSVYSSTSMKMKRLNGKKDETAKTGEC